MFNQKSPRKKEEKKEGRKGEREGGKGRGREGGVRDQNELILIFQGPAKFITKSST